MTFLQMTLRLYTYAHPWVILCIKKHRCQQSAFFATNAPSTGAQMRSTTNLRSGISSRALAIFQSIGKARKLEVV